MSTTIGRSPRVFVPLHISGFWVPRRGPDVLSTGSVGAGITIVPHLVAWAKAVGTCGIYVNGSSSLASHATHICARHGIDLSIGARTSVGLGLGAGVSAALSLALSSLASLITRRYIDHRATWPAHEAEVLNGTGLGDVMAEYLGGLVVRTRPGPPGVGEAQRIVVSEDPSLLLVDLGTRISTKEMLDRMDGRALSAGAEALQEFLEEPTLERFFEISRRFTATLFNYTTAFKALEGLRGVVSYFVKKNLLVLWAEDEFVDEVREALGARGLWVIPCRLSRTGLIAL
ncbi:MAG: hypothetical protein ABWK00_05135 [Desulfurococcaceae archaeon]